jgi:hypothetical protein
VLFTIVVHEPEKRRVAVATYAVVTWLAAMGVGIFEGSQIVNYLQRNHPAYLAELRKVVRSSHAPFPVMESSLAGTREFVDSTESRGDPLLSQYRQRARRLRWLMPLAFAHWILVILLMLLFT